MGPGQLESSSDSFWFQEKTNFDFKTKLWNWKIKEEKKKVSKARRKDLNFWRVHQHFKGSDKPLEFTLLFSAQAPPPPASPVLSCVSVSGWVATALGSETLPVSFPFVPVCVSNHLHASSVLSLSLSSLSLSLSVSTCPSSWLLFGPCPVALTWI